MACIGAVADDLTGATTTGVLLARSGAKTVAFFNEEAAANSGKTGDFKAVIVSSNTRPLKRTEAYEKVKSATKTLKDIGVEHFSKRIDTTLRGGVGVEIDAMLDELGGDYIAVVVPAMPQSRRILVGGYSIIDGVSLVKTPVAQDVRTPVRENYIPRLLDGQSRRNIGLVKLDQVLAGIDELKTALKENRRSGCEIIVVDAVSLEDIDNIAKACIELAWNMVAVDPGPFTSKLAYHRGVINDEKPNLPDNANAHADNKTVVVVAGSATPVTKQQIEKLCQSTEHIHIAAEPMTFINGGRQAEEEIERIVKQVMDALEEGFNPTVILIETALRDNILNLKEEDRIRGYAEGFSANRINAGLGMAVSKLLEKVGRQRVAGLYTTGGDTMVNVCYQLGVESIELIDYVIPQTDIGRLVGSYDGMPIVGKGGLTGNENTACEIIERIFMEAKRSN